MSKSFTPKELDDYALYEYVRSSGEYNMFGLRAQQATGLSRENYLFVMENYTALKQQFKQELSDDDARVMRLAEYFTGAG